MKSPISLIGIYPTYIIAEVHNYVIADLVLHYNGLHYSVDYPVMIKNNLILSIIGTVINYNKSHVNVL